MSDIDIITVRWDAERDVYKVNRPNWSGGEVVLWSAVKTMLASQAAEVARLRAGGCARDQRTTQYCAEAQAALARVEAAEKDAGRMREFLLAFINGGVNQDFRLWASKVLSDMEGGKC